MLIYDTGVCEIGRLTNGSVMIQRAKSSKLRPFRVGLCRSGLRTAGLRLLFAKAFNNVAAYEQMRARICIFDAPYRAHAKHYVQRGRLRAGRAPYALKPNFGAHLLVEMKARIPHTYTRWVQVPDELLEGMCCSSRFRKGLNRHGNYNGIVYDLDRFTDVAREHWPVIMDVWFVIRVL